MPNTDNQTRKILVIDDEDMIRNIVKRIMKIKGHETTEASTGDEAIRILKQNTDFDYIILDLSMPGKLTGKDTFQNIREISPDSEIIISTGFIDSTQKQYYKSHGAYAILEKPYQMEEITALIK